MMIEKFRLTPKHLAELYEAQRTARKRRLCGKTLVERIAIIKAEDDAQEADALREALSEERWGKA
jgi:hypothetical protein